MTLNSITRSPRAPICFEICQDSLEQCEICGMYWSGEILTHRHSFALDSMLITWLHNSSHAVKNLSVSSYLKAHNLQSYEILSLTPSMPLIVISKPTRASFSEIFLHEEHHDECNNMSRSPSANYEHLLSRRSLPWRSKSGCGFSWMTNWTSWNEPGELMLQNNVVPVRGQNAGRSDAKLSTGHQWDCALRKRMHSKIEAKRKSVTIGLLISVVWKS